ncbi:MAG: sigma E protease regulator RseP [Gammaproteobacteria bacterium]|nr:sigma E protease regulator RseP [Gammaproteobacteria bacterium]
MGSILFSFAAFIVALGILITVHEFGHYWVARRAGVKVLRFSVGFGRPLWKRVAGPDQTEYVIAAIPLGGYVKMLDEREGDVPEEDLPRAFNRQSLSKRFAIVFAGPLFNFIFAILAYWVMFMTGIPGIKPIIGQIEEASIAQQAGLKFADQIISIDGEQAISWGAARMMLITKSLDKSVVELKVEDEDKRSRIVDLDLSLIASEIKDGRILEELGISQYRPKIPVVIGKLIDDGRAIAAGLKVGDTILFADDQKMDNWEAWVTYVRARPEKVINIELNRQGVQHNLELTPARVVTKEGDEIGLIGAAPDVSGLSSELRVIEKYSPVYALIAAGEKTWNMSILTLRMIGKMLFGEVSLDNLSGPLTIADYAGQTASIGWDAFLMFLAIVSISLGVLNLLPIPLLDGGHLMFYIIELIKGSPIAENIESIFQRVGMFFLFLLMSVAIYNDFARMFN